MRLGMRSEFCRRSQDMSQEVSVAGHVAIDGEESGDGWDKGGEGGSIYIHP